MGMLIFSSLGSSKEVAQNKSQLEGYPIASDVFTTLQRTVVPDSIPSGSEAVLPYEISKFKKKRLWQLELWTRYRFCKAARYHAD